MVFKGNMSKINETTAVCRDCPRECGVDRNNSIGYCKTGNNLLVARAALHMWEEPCVSGENGSGAIFFSGCNMQCVFCQNRDIATAEKGRQITVSRLAEIMCELQQKGANNINLVTPSHYVNQIIRAIELARTNGMELPIVYNTSSYEKVETLKKLEGYVDVYLPDCKYYDDNLAVTFSRAPGYNKIAMDAITEMRRQVGTVSFDSNGIIQKGVIVRHLVLPGHTKDSMQVIKGLWESFGHDIYISIMSQYTPLKHVEGYQELNRRITAREYNKVVDYALELGIENGFFQDMDVAMESFIPSFDGEGV